MGPVRIAARDSGRPACFLGCPYRAQSSTRGRRLNGSRRRLCHDVSPVLQRLIRGRLVLCVRVSAVPPADVVQALKVAVKNGINTVEVTMTTPHALEIVQALRRETDALVGVGTVMSTSEALSAHDAGAQFLLSPIADKDTIRACNDKDIVMIPGAMTPSEIYHAYWHWRAPAVKVYPYSSAGALAYIQSLSGSLPDIPLVPTSGVELESVQSLLRLPNVLAVGISTQVLSADVWPTRDWDLLAHNTRQWSSEAGTP